MADPFGFSVKLVGQSRVKTIFESDGFWTKHVQDFSKVAKKESIVADIEYAKSKGKVLQIVYLSRHNSAGSTYKISHIDCYGCGNEWHIEDGVWYRPQFDLELRTISVEFGLFLARKVKCKRCGTIYEF